MSCIVGAKPASLAPKLREGHHKGQGKAQGSVQNLCIRAEGILTLGEVFTEDGGREPQVPGRLLNLRVLGSLGGSRLRS